MAGQKGTESEHRRQRRLRWDLLLAAACIAAASVIIVGFGTGRAENDIMGQARQMLGMKAVSDWHPPVIVAVWRGLYAITGSVGSLFALQIILYFLGVFLMAVFAHRRLKSRLGSVAVLVVSASPWAYSALNTPWKDTIMAAALLIAAGAVALARPRGGKSLLLIILALAMLVFATLERKNGIAAVVPICAYIGYRFSQDAVRALRRSAPRKLQEPKKLRRTATAAAAAVPIVAVGGERRRWSTPASGRGLMSRRPTKPTRCCSTTSCSRFRRMSSIELMSRTT